MEIFIRPVARSATSTSKTAVALEAGFSDPVLPRRASQPVAEGRISSISGTVAHQVPLPVLQDASVGWTRGRPSALCGEVVGSRPPGSAGPYRMSARASPPSCPGRTSPEQSCGERGTGQQHWGARVYDHHGAGIGLAHTPYEFVLAARQCAGVAVDALALVFLGGADDEDHRISRRLPRPSAAPPRETDRACSPHAPGPALQHRDERLTLRDDKHRALSGKHPDSFTGRHTGHAELWSPARRE